jgi:hypothetical protein
VCDKESLLVTELAANLTTFSISSCTFREKEFVFFSNPKVFNTRTPSFWGKKTPATNMAVTGVISYGREVPLVFHCFFHGNGNGNGGTHHRVVTHTKEAHHLNVSRHRG